MAIPTITGLGPDPSFEDVTLKINSLVNELRNTLLTLDTINVLELNAEVITANTVTADKMNVNQLSAISANLGHIIAGVVESIQMISSIITGSLIQTSPEGVFPRIELASSNRVFRVQGSPDDDLRMYVAGTQPILLFSNQFGTTTIDKVGSDFTTYNTANININSGGRVYLNGVDIISTLNGKANAFYGITGSVSLTNVGGGVTTLLFSNGILTSVI